MKVTLKLMGTSVTLPCPNKKVAEMHTRMLIQMKSTVLKKMTSMMMPQLKVKATVADDKINLGLHNLGRKKA
jgi:hypothetical protein